MEEGETEGIDGKELSCGDEKGGEGEGEAGGEREDKTDDEGVEKNCGSSGEPQGTAAKEISAESGKKGGEGAEDDVQDARATEKVTEKAAYGEAGDSFWEKSRQQRQGFGDANLDASEGDRGEKQTKNGIDGGDQCAANETITGKVQFHKSSKEKRARQTHPQSREIPGVFRSFVYRREVCEPSVRLCFQYSRFGVTLC